MVVDPIYKYFHDIEKKYELIERKVNKSGLKKLDSTFCAFSVEIERHKFEILTKNNRELKVSKFCLIPTLIYIQLLERKNYRNLKVINM